MTDGEVRPPGPHLDSDPVKVPMSASDRGPGEGENPGGEEGEEEGSSTGNAPAGSSGSSGQDHAPDLVVDDEEQVLYPGLAPVVFFCVKQTTRPRSWCLRMVCNPYPLQGRVCPASVSKHHLCFPSKPIGGSIYY
ncbi:hypothetical protein Z043_104506 [Scleropages formosus]|uniref:Voltage-dependent T-type calcium channel subunit alpha-1I-like n=1 Tax=Scleropages formosus TaxID=113540 RepID=A0A0P7XI55_SCLFO|nr:hypothetical protein Z043_104506 [Scleropages formosus]